MPDLVADDRADGAVVDRVVRLEVEERRLQDGGREDDLVHARIVVGVHRLRCHEPFGPIDRAAQALQAPLVVPGASPGQVAESVVTVDLELRVVFPLVRVADLRRELLAFFLRLGLGRVRHPIEVVDGDLEGAQQVPNQLIHALLGVGREMALDVDLAHSLTDGGIYRLNRTLPAWLHLLLAVDQLARELELSFGKLVGQPG